MYHGTITTIRKNKMSGMPFWGPLQKQWYIPGHCHVSATVDMIKPCHFDVQECYAMQKHIVRYCP